ncbi:UDP-2,3-diacylglucosamine diphosphatase [soil metagenome]
MKNKTQTPEKRRPVEVVVLSDVHLGTYGCHAKELTEYLRSVKPEMLILNGDIIDMWQFSKKYFPKSHMKVLKEIVKLASKGVPVYYVTGNHDELLRKFAGFRLGNLEIVNKIVFELDGKTSWVFHGDVFDVSMQHAKWLTKLGAVGYDLLIIINSFCNYVLGKMGRDKISLSKKIKNSVKSAVKFINNFEDTCAEIAIRNGYDNVLCGHIHHPEIKVIHTDKGSVNYLNSGDWVENLTALEYHDKEWTLYRHPLNSDPSDIENTEDDFVFMNNKEIFGKLMEEIYASPGALKQESVIITR